MTGLRFLFRVTLRRLDLLPEMYFIKEPSCRRRALPARQVPLILNQDEARRLLAMTDNVRNRLLLSIGYGAGLRAGEVVRLKVKHIDRGQMIIRVVAKHACGMTSVRAEHGFAMTPGPERPARDAVARDDRSAGGMVAAAHEQVRSRRAGAGTLAVPRLGGAIAVIDADTVEQDGVRWRLTLIRDTAAKMLRTLGFVPGNT